MTRKKPTHPAIHPLFRVAPGETVVYWPLPAIAEEGRADMFVAARQAADAGHVSLHCRGDKWIAMGKVR